MKYIYKIFLLFLVVTGVTSCDENENFAILPAQESFKILTPSSGSVIVLDDTNLLNTALFISWQSTSSIEGASFTIEAAETGTDFANPVVIGTTTGNNFSMTVGELNTFLLDVMGLKHEEAASVDIRVLANGEVTETISIVFTPYKVEFTEFYLVGSLTGWDPATSLPMTRLDLNIFEITIDLADDDAFKFLPTNTGWDGDFGEDPNNPGSLISEGEQDISGYPAGKYKVTVDLNTFTFTVVEVIAPDDLFLVGSLTGWDPPTSLPFFKAGENVFTVVIDLPEGGEFKFLPQNTGWDGDWGEDPNNPGSIIQDGEQNVSGYAAGKYLVTVDFNTLTYKLSSVDNLFLVGSLTGWDPGTSLPMGAASLGNFSIIIDLPDGAEFKFLPQNTGWDGDWGADGDNAGRIIQDNEQNLSGYAAGKYVISVNFNTLSYTVSPVTEIPSTLYLVGAFSGWSNDAGNPQFTEISSGVFEISQTLSAGDEFKFVPVAGSWDNDWGQSPTTAGVIQQDGENNLNVANAGTYVIQVNFNTGTVSVVLD